MLTCEQTRAALPGLLTGESTDPEVREHVAQCETCRAERDRLEADFQHVRHELAALAPTPFLEDAVREAAAGGSDEAPATRPPRWLYVGVAAAALLLLFLFVRPWPRSDSPPDAKPADGDGTAAGASIRVPPSATQVEAARKKNEATRPGGRPDWRWKPGEEHVKYHQATGPADAKEYVATASEAFLPPDPQAHHRYVYGDVAGMPDAVSGMRSDTRPKDGVMVLGQALLDRIGGEIRRGAGVDLVVGERKWSTTAGTSEGELFVGSPDEGGAEARVRVLVRPGYEGTLFLEEPVSRALGLHQFEIPGRVMTTNASTGFPSGVCQRARARVRIPELAFDEVVEVQVRPSAVRAASGATYVSLEFPLEISWTLGPIQVLQGRVLEIEPDGVVVGDAVVVEPEGDAERREIRIDDPGAFRMIVRLPGGTAALPEEVWIVFGAYDAGLPIRVVPLVLGADLPVGAEVVIAPVWRGTTALPSRTAVVRTKVAADGRVHAATVVGEKVSTLRMLVTPPDGEPAFRDVVVRPDLLPNPRHAMTVRADGTIRVGGKTLQLLDDSGGFMPDRLLPLLSEVLRPSPAKRDPDGGLRDVLDLRVEAGTSWRVIQWILQSGAHPDVRMKRFRLGLLRDDRLEGVPIPYELPVDPGIQPEEGPGEPDTLERPARLVVTVIRSKMDDPLTVLLRKLPAGSEMRWQPANLEIPVRDAVKAIRGETEGLQGVVTVPPGHVTYEEIYEVLDALREAGIDDVLFHGTPPPVPGRSPR